MYVLRQGRGSREFAYSGMDARGRLTGGKPWQKAEVK